MLRRTFINLPSLFSSSSSILNYSNNTKSDLDSMWDLFNEKKNTTPQPTKKKSYDEQLDEFHQEQQQEETFDPTNTVLNTTTKEERLKNFGMFGFASSGNEINDNLEEIPALFKQSWIDFFVSEIPTGQSKHVSRSYDFTVPEFPPWLLTSMSLQELVGVLDDQEAKYENLLTDLSSSSSSSSSASENTKSAHNEISSSPPPSSPSAITSQESLFKNPEEIESDVRRKERKAREMLENAAKMISGIDSAFDKTSAGKMLADEKARHGGTGVGGDGSSSSISSSLGARKKKRDYFLQCILHKQGVADGTARSLIGKALSVHPNDITASGVKDFKGDTVQLIRIRNASPLAAIRANYWMKRVQQREKEQKSKIRAKSGFEDLVFSSEALKATTEAQEQEQDAMMNKKNNKSDRIAKDFPKPSPYPNPNNAPNLIISHFSYETKPLLQGNLEGNHFRIVLRDVPSSVTDERLQIAADNLRTYGFPNFYGCQRFSWFGPMEHDPGYALLHGDIINFAYRLLEFTNTKRTLRELLQRKQLFPTPFQESYRRALIKRLDDNGINPNVLDSSEYLLSCPVLGTTTEVLHSPESIELDEVKGNRRELVSIFRVFSCMRQALADIPGTGRRLCCQSTCSFFWNLCLSERIRRYGLRQVLPGDLVVPASLKPLRERINQEFTDLGKIGFVDRYGHQVLTKKQVEQASIFDVFHPAFQFHGKQIVAADEIKDIMMEICDEYQVPWEARGPKRLGIMKDFLETPRPIVAKAANFSWSRRKDDPSVLEVEFSLGKGSYANVALREFLKCACACPGHEEVITKPLSAETWTTLGKMDPGGMRITVEDLYPEWIPEHGMADLPDEKAEPLDIYTYEGEWTKKNDREAKERWANEVIPRNMVRREKLNVMRKKELFEPAIAKTITDQQMLRYAGHSVPLSPNAPRKKIQKMVFVQKMKREKDPRRRRLLAAMQRKGNRNEEYMRASREFSWTPQR